MNKTEEGNEDIKEENAEYRYDENDKLYYAENGDNTAEFDYSVNGYRIVKRENSGIPVFFIYDMQNRLAAEAQLVNMQKSDGTVRTVMYPIMQYIWGADRVLAKLDKLTNKRYYYLYNGHGDAVQIVDTSGNVVNSYDYDVWGNFIEKNETIDNPFTYFGQTYDETTGLYYLRARYYAPSTGRFTQQDFAEDGYNWYVYGNQNPVMFVDPSGLEWNYTLRHFPKPVIRGLVFGQSSNANVSNLNFFNSLISDVGCEITAIHNALFLQNDYGENFIDILNSCRRISYIPNTGWAGCQPKRIGEVLDEYSATYYKTTSLNDMYDNFYRDSVNIISFWNNMDGYIEVAEGLHTICFYIAENDKVTAYNVTNYQRSYRFYDSVWEFVEDVMPNENRFIVFYGDIHYE